MQHFFKSLESRAAVIFCIFSLFFFFSCFHAKGDLIPIDLKALAAFGLGN